jgi:23S rRNA (uracil1939-C5)-methyltransferase
VTSTADPTAATPDFPEAPLELVVRDLSLEGDGIAVPPEGVERDPLPVLVPGALPGERVRVLITGQGQRFRHGELQDLLVAAPDRREPPCLVAGACGGCSLQHWVDASQANWKEQQLRRTLQRVGGLSPTVRPILAAEATLAYRNRAILPLRHDGGCLQAGFYRRGSHELVPIDHCPVLDERIDRLIAPLCVDLSSAGWPVYDEATGQGVLRHLVLRVGHHSGDLLVGLIAASDDLPGLEELAADWMRRWPELVGVVLNLQPRPTNVLFGAKERLVAGRPWLLDRFGGCTVPVAIDTFHQVHTPQAERLLPLLREALDLRSGDRLLDAYCGSASLSLPLLAPGIDLVGFERHRTSVELAELAAQLNGLDRVKILVGAVDQLLPEWLPDSRALLLDPPRKGLETAVREAILADPPERLAYVSCNPATLARDLAQLTRDGQLSLEWVQPLDFFPQTTHCEAVASLVRSADQR